MEMGCGQGRGDRIDVYERRLKQQLADLHMECQRQAQPILFLLARIEADKPPRPVWMNGMWHVMQMPGAQAPESPGDRMHRLERERDQALHLLRMVRGASEPWITQLVDQLLKEMKP
jgi:hypothetical protein